MNLKHHVLNLLSQALLNFRAVLRQSHDGLGVVVAGGHIIMADFLRFLDSEEATGNRQGPIEL